MGLPLNAQCTPTITAGPQCLPAELLEEIFIFLAHIHSLSLVKVLQVNRQWNEVATASPRLWQHITLDAETRDIPFLHAQARLWMQRSDPLPYDIHIGLEDVNMCLPILSPFIPSLHRWTSLTFLWRGYMYNTHIPNYFSDIYALGVTLRDAELWQEDLEMPDADLSAFLPWFSPTMFISTISKLPSSGDILPIQLTELTIMESSPTGSARPAEIMHFLSALPQLKRLVLHLWAHDLRESDTFPPLISLPSLRHLELLNTFAPRLFLSRLHTPALRALRLMNLNVHHTLANIFQYDEDGDSADEAGDFSQSPWSDHGIGMGLRSLVHRSRPPLESLDMDYADMRTKDFRWCFDHLTGLRTFRIVGSDMSDSVIDFFRPYSPQPTQDGTPEQLVLRMPLLSCLDFTGCLRISGDNVVDAIRAREEFIMSSSDKTRMREVIVTRCPGVDARHGDTLRQLLGSRFHSP